MGATVVLVKVSLTHQIVKTVFVVVELLAELVCLTFTVCQFVTVQATEVYAQPLILYSPPVTDMAAAALMPETVMADDSITVDKATLV